jgi:hypothetical protein
VTSQVYLRQLSIVLVTASLWLGSGITTESSRRDRTQHVKTEKPPDPFFFPFLDKIAVSHSVTKRLGIHADDLHNRKGFRSFKRAVMGSSLTKSKISLSVFLGEI